MAEIKITRVEKGQTKIRNVPIAVTPEGFWCCPSPVMFPKNFKPQNPPNKPKSSSPIPKTPVQKKQNPDTEKNPSFTSSRSGHISGDESKNSSETVVSERPKIENLPKKVSIDFGEPGTSDLKVVLLGKQGFTVKLNTHRHVLVDNTRFFAEKLSEQQPCLRSLVIDDCEDVEIYVETVGLMYCKELKQRLIKQSVSRVLRILKVAEQLGFSACMDSCLEFLEAVPWVGEEEEEKVITSVLRLQSEGIRVTPILKRVSSDISRPARDTLSHVIELVLKSNEERARREMKSIVLKLLKENNTVSSTSSSSNEVYKTTIYTSCGTCLDSLLSLFRQAADFEFNDNPVNLKDHVMKQIALEADNLTWLLEILAEKHAADELAVMWASQQELASLHPKLPIMNRYHVSCITSRIFVGIGRGEILPTKDTRHLLLQTWLEPLMNDYNWLLNGCRTFDRNVVEEGIGRTILTLPLEDQQVILLGWLSNFLKGGDKCPNLQKAFEVWWRRTFVRTYVEQGSVDPSSDNLMT